ncbi:MAG: HAD-IA family hydrolase [Candidatus Aenigmarchaeota archaeon]|nr:HAD-IA family hydrolase [Candidatus Aenigmarchaeota archaeon]
MKLKAILFDVDGVLLDSIKYYIRYLKKIVKAMKLEMPSDKEIRFSFGMPWFEGVKKLWPHIDMKKFKKTDKKISSKTLLNLKPFPNAIKSVHEIKKTGIKIGIVTMGNREHVYKKMTRSGYDLELFDCIVTRSDVKRSRPHPDAILLACKKLKIKPKDALYVGDTLLDHESAKRADINYVSVTCGTLTKNELIENKVLNFVKDVSELPKLIKNKKLFFIKKTVSCYVLFNNKLLLLKRSNKVVTYPNKWSVIHGHIEDGETPLQTAVKEIKEETGLKPKLIKQRPSVFKDEKYNIIWETCQFLFESKTDKIKYDWEHDDYKWIDPKEVKKYDTIPNLWKSVDEILKK